jgi:hypothetical protein
VRKGTSTGPSPKLRTEALRFLNQAKRDLFLHEWNVEVFFAPTADAEPGVIAHVDADPVYLNARITVYPDYATLSPDRRQHSLTHELVHLLVAELGELLQRQASGLFVSETTATAAIERLTQRITNAVHALALHSRRK